MHSMRDMAGLLFLVSGHKPLLPHGGLCSKHVTMMRATRRHPTVNWESRVEEEGGRWEAVMSEQQRVFVLAER